MGNKWTAAPGKERERERDKGSENVNGHENGIRFLRCDGMCTRRWNGD